MTDHTEYDPVTLEILWNRLIAIADEAAAALVRTSFSSTVRESNDYACVLLDSNGDTLAENRGSIPSFCGCVARTMRHFLHRFPKDTWEAGDVVITNDPWMATGHRPDFTMATPIMHAGKLVGFAGSIAHSPDIGGVLWSADCTEVFEEGLGVPPLRFYRAGKLNQEFVEIFRANCRVPDQSIGDLQAMVAAGDIMATRVIELLDDQNMKDLSSLGSVLQARAETAMRTAIRALPSGSYQSVVELDGFDDPIRIVCTLTIDDDEITVDYTGTSAEIDRGINSVMNYTWAYSTYPIKCAVDPESPKNEGSYRPIKITAPEGCIVNTRFPRAVNSRHLVAHTLSAAIYQALAQANPAIVIADSGSAPTLRTLWAGTGHDGERFSFILFANGGMGARPTKDGLPCTPFPTNSTCASIEVMESVTPLIVRSQTDQNGFRRRGAMAWGIWPRDHCSGR